MKNMNISEVNSDRHYVHLLLNRKDTKTGHQGQTH